MQDSNAWLVHFHAHGGEEVVLPRGEEDGSEMAWFAKLSAVWEDVRWM